jgi:hypothetical protein
VWVFHGTAARFAAGIFDSKAAGLAWAARHRVSGILAEYEVGDGCFDVAVRDRRFRLSKPHHGSPEHVAGFSPGLGHVHLVHGVPD